MVELRKRKAAPAPPPPTTKKTKADAPSKVAKAKAAISKTIKGAAGKTPTTEEATNGTAKGAGGSLAVGDIISVNGFGGEVETEDGTKTDLKTILHESKAGVVLFTYPKASTPGCESPLSSLA
jgi:thioredoxin-dependent peroxiredoxin